MKKLIFSVLIILFAVGIFAQEKDAFKASMASLFIPAGGQFYNESYWKAATVLGFEAYYTSMFFYHDKQMDKYKKKIDDPLDENLFENEIKYNENYEAKQNDLWWLGIIVILSSADAYVDAKLYSFDEEKKRIHLMFKEKTIGIDFRF